MSLEIYVASAGTGKTSKLAHLLEEALLGTNGTAPCRPEAVLATTFTRQAAAELRERARGQLLSHGRVEAAQQLNAAMIGTVNSVCGRIISDFAMELGLSPEVRVLDEHEATAAMEQVLSQCAGQDEQQEVYTLARTVTELNERDSPLHWLVSVRRIVELARANGITAPDLEASRQRSIGTLMALLGDPVADGTHLERALQQALQTFVNSVDLNEHTGKNTAKAVREARDALGTLNKGWRLSWGDWVKLANLDAGAKLRNAVEDVHNTAAMHDRHPLLRTELERAVTLIFAIAKRAMNNYDRYKQERGVIDFVDQEVLALRALHTPAIADELRHRIDLVLVDEFQDTSPLQLAIFLKLAELAPRSIWVGDQKQAIYSFRGTDPALMNAALEELADNGNGELVDKTLQQLTGHATVFTLDKSWRSRPSLVRLTSKVFAAAFALHDVPPERVEIAPGLTDEDQRLGPALEHWKLQIDKASATTQLPQPVAAGVRALLEDTTAMIRDRATGDVRRVQAQDIGILCRTNAQCVGVAAALTTQGVAAQVPRVGLFATEEGCALLAALHLWHDPRASLPKAELSRLLGNTTDPGAWLNTVLEANADTPVWNNDVTVRAVLAAREGSLSRDVLGCFDACIEAMQLREHCLTWGNSAQRLANLDAMRTHAASYVNTCQARGEAVTLVGLLYHLADVQEDRQDAWARTDEGNAVVVTTWHGSKGLEWPVVVLFGMEPGRDRPLRTLGARAETPEGPVNLRAVLQNRWIRYWCTPYKGANTKMPFHERLTQAPLAVNAKLQQEREELRLLYVGWTRARDRLVLATHAYNERFSEGMLRHLRDTKGMLLEPFDGPEVTWLGQTVQTVSRELTGLAPVSLRPRPGSGYATVPPVAHPPAYAQPSSIGGTGRYGERLAVGKPISVRGKANPRQLGQAVHAFIAADDPTYPESTRLGMAQDLARAWSVHEHLRDADLLVASDQLHAWASKTWTIHRWLREVPMHAPTPEGTRLAGRADLVLETAEGYVIIDHKSFAGDVDLNAVPHLQAYFGQLAAYRTMLTAATGKPVLGSFLYLPLLGTVVELFHT